MRGGLLLLFFFLGVPFLACDKKQPEPAPKAEVSGTTKAAVAPSASASAAAEDDLCQGQPYKRRCEKSCKDAQQEAFKNRCKAEAAAFTGSNDASFGKCMTDCRDPNADSTCVGAADRKSCECQLKCYLALPALELNLARAAARCYHKEIAAACE